MKRDGPLPNSQVPTTCPYSEPEKSIKTPLTQFSHLLLGLPCGLFPSGFPTKNLYTPLLPHKCHMSCPSPFPLSHHPNNI